MREPMTEQLRQALDRAQLQARQLNQDFVGTEHLLLGILGSNHAAGAESEAVRALRRSEINLDELRAELVDALPRCTEPPVVTGSLPLSPKTKRALNSALVTAQSTRQPRVSTRLMLRALLEDPEAEIQVSLRACGANLDQLQKILDEPPPNPED